MGSSEQPDLTASPGAESAEGLAVVSGAIIQA